MATDIDERARPTKCRIPVWLAPALIAAAAWGMPLPGAPAQTAPPKPSRSADDKRTCIENLKRIYEAIEAYRTDRHDLPNWLSDLVPKYLDDPNALVCPVSRRTGQTEKPPLVDPKLPSSYLFEFCPVPLGNLVTNAPKRTRREWKRRQMGLVGSQVPIVRCRFHLPVLNLAFDGRIYESPPSWELLFTNRVNEAALSPPGMFPEARPPGAANAKKAPAPLQFSARSPTARKALLDLTPFYNASLKGSKGYNLSALPTGVQTLGGVEFDIRGMIQLGSKSPLSLGFPVSVDAIPVHQQCRRLHFLHAAAFGDSAEEGNVIGTYVVHYAGGRPPVKIPIRYGHEVRDCHSVANATEAPPELNMVWQALPPPGKAWLRLPQLFLTTWTNATPNQEIESLDFVSGVATAAPFVVAITAD